MERHDRQTGPGRQPRARISVEGLEDRCVPAGLGPFQGVISSQDLPLSNVQDSILISSIPFEGPVLSVPTALTDGRLPFVAFTDGTMSAIRLQANGMGWSDIVLARNLPLPGSVAGEIRLTLQSNPIDQVVFGIQITVSMNPPLSTSTPTRPRAIVESSPIYSYSTLQTPTAPPIVPPAQVPPPIPGSNGGIQTPPTLPEPPTETPPSRPAAPISESVFEAGTTLAETEIRSIRGSTTTVEFTKPATSTSESSRVTLNYSFIQVPEVGISEPPPARRVSTDDRIPQSEMRRFVHLTQTFRTAELPVAHGIALAEAEPADGSPGIRELLERIAREDPREVIPVGRKSDEREPTSDRNPYWFLAALFGLGVSQYLKRDPKSSPDFVVI